MSYFTLKRPFQEFLKTIDSWNNIIYQSTRGRRLHVLTVVFSRCMFILPDLFSKPLVHTIYFSCHFSPDAFVLAVETVKQVFRLPAELLICQVSLRESGKERGNPEKLIAQFVKFDGRVILGERIFRNFRLRRMRCVQGIEDNIIRSGLGLKWKKRGKLSNLASRF